MQPYCVIKNQIGKIVKLIEETNFGYIKSKHNSLAFFEFKDVLFNNSKLFVGQDVKFSANFYDRDLTSVSLEATKIELLNNEENDDILLEVPTLKYEKVLGEIINFSVELGIGYLRSDIEKFVYFETKNLLYPPKDVKAGQSVLCDINFYKNDVSYVAKASNISRNITGKELQKMIDELDDISSFELQDEVFSDIEVLESFDD